MLSRCWTWKTLWRCRCLYEAINTALLSVVQFCVFSISICCKSTAADSEDGGNTNTTHIKVLLSMWTCVSNCVQICIVRFSMKARMTHE